MINFIIISYYKWVNIKRGAEAVVALKIEKGNEIGMNPDKEAPITSAEGNRYKWNRHIVKNIHLSTK